MYPQSTPILDFNLIDTHDPLTIGIADTSVYPSTFTIVNPTLQITPPGFNLVSLPYTKNTAVFLNSNQLNLTCVTDPSLLSILPDGIWTVSISVSPSITYNKTKTFLRTINLQQEFGKAFLKTNLTQCSQDVRVEQMKVIDEISYYIDAAVAAANQCNNVLAMNLYQTANTMLVNFVNASCKGETQTLYC